VKRDRKRAKMDDGKECIGNREIVDIGTRLE
jgi:hypothetical protein